MCVNILVTGGLGYIGSHICAELAEAGCEAVILDDCSNASPRVLDRLTRITGKTFPFYRNNVSDEAALDRIFTENRIEVVIHLAAFKSAPESTKLPLEYYTNNVAGTLALLRAMERHGVRRIVYSSSACVYGGVEEMPVGEDAPVSAINPYGETKLMCERIISDLCRADGRWSALLLRYFNPVGAHSSGLIGEDPRGIPGNVAPRLLRVLTGRDEVFTLTGTDFPTPDGTGIRDYLHVVDLARGHVSAARRVMETSGALTLNLGTGCGVSVLEMMHAFERAAGRPIPYSVHPRRPGDAAESVARAELAREVLGWQAEYSLDDMCRDAWRWQENNPHGYED